MALSELQSSQPQDRQASRYTRRSVQSTSSGVAKLYWNSRGQPCCKCKVLGGPTVVSKNTRPNTSSSPPISEEKDGSRQQLLAGSSHSEHCARVTARPLTVVLNSHAIPSRVPLDEERSIYSIEGFLTAQRFPV